MTRPQYKPRPQYRGVPRLRRGAPSVWGRGAPRLRRGATSGWGRGAPRLRRGRDERLGSRRATASPGARRAVGVEARHGFAGGATSGWGRGAPRLRRGRDERLGSRRATASPGRDERVGSRRATASPGRDERLGGLGGHFGAPHLLSAFGLARSHLGRQRDTDPLRAEPLEHALAQLVLDAELVDEAPHLAGERELERVVAEARDEPRRRRRLGEEPVDLPDRAGGLVDQQTLDELGVRVVVDADADEHGHPRLTEVVVGDDGLRDPLVRDY